VATTAAVTSWSTRKQTGGEHTVQKGRTKGARWSSSREGKKQRWRFDHRHGQEAEGRGGVLVVRFKRRTEGGKKGCGGALLNGVGGSRGGRRRK
jgi:hypothetical protein